VPGDADAASRAIDPVSLEIGGVEGPRLVFVNGAYRADLSRSAEPEGVSIATLRQAGEAEVGLWREPLLREYRGREAAFARLNTALAADGPLIRVAPGARVAQPIHIVFVGAGAEREIAWNARALIDVGAGASLQMIEHHVDQSATAPHLGNVVTQIALGDGAELDLVGIQNAGTNATLIRRTELALGAEAVLASHEVEIGARLGRHDVVVDLGGRGARFRSRGVFALRGRQHVDIHLDVRHDARDTASDIVWRGVADERARGVLHGAITVAAGADGADAALSSKNLLLSPHAEIDTQPVLEIHTDEVKAAHGATVGQLDERALFYLRSRGLPLESARRMLIAAFCGAVIADTPSRVLREMLDTLLASRLTPGNGES
jgi:Fe-S cluster assembly protein SufD